MKPIKTVAVLFGGRSVEHEVSIITGHQIMEALEQAGFSVLPIYISKDGAWYAGEPLQDLKFYRQDPLPLRKKSGVVRVSLSPDRTVRELIVHPEHKGVIFKKTPVLWADVFFPALHGSFGEDGALQGVFEMADVPYVGSGIAASAIAIDKVITKQICRAIEISVLECSVIGRNEWENSPTQFIEKVELQFGFPLIVKPISLGSSIGVARCEDRKQLHEALKVALALDQRALVERALTDFIEINCAVFGPPEKASVCEQPIPRSGILTFDDKYKRGGKKTGKAPTEVQGMAALERLVPAPISGELNERVQMVAKQAFKTIGASGVARIDFLYEQKTDSLHLNEINTLPGSLAYYLWEASGLLFDQLVTDLLNQAVARHRYGGTTQVAFSGNLLLESPKP